MHAHARRRSVLTAVGMLLVGVLASCAGTDKYALTLRARDDDGNSFINIERHWLAADGRHASSPPNSATFRLASSPIFGDVECGGEKLQRRYARISNTELVKFSFELQVDDGNVLTLVPQKIVRVAARSTPWASCVEASGRWEGTAGNLRGQTGTFTIHYDSIQTVLRLVED